jgi:hypothetical protein
VCRVHHVAVGQAGLDRVGHPQREAVDDDRVLGRDALDDRTELERLLDERP